MRKLVLVVLLLTAAMWVWAAQQQVVPANVNGPLNPNMQRSERVFYQETFEDGATDWTHYDGTLPSSMWHTSTTGAYGGTGSSWWMGDESIGGYINNLYVTLDTPAITVPSANPVLSFNLNYACETPGGETAPYDGWDGCNVRISTNGGTTWTVLTPTSPAYNCGHLYSFGSIHGEGTAIAGWGGTSNGWVNASFNLAAYAGQSVKIRFAFASDGAYCTQNDHNLFGMKVDNITLGSFSNNGDTTGDMVAGSGVPVGGDLWHIVEDSTAPSPTHAYICQNSSGSYNSGMLNYLVSPSITLPVSGDIRADFELTGSFTDPDSGTSQVDDKDYWGFEISPDNGTTWYAMSNPYNDPDASNYVYTDAPSSWTFICSSYSLDGMISNYAGQTVKFRIYFRSDADDPDGTGIILDDFTIYNSLFLPAPRNLAVDNTDNSTYVDLSWTDPYAGGETGWLQWCSDEYYTAFGSNSGSSTWQAAARFWAEDLLPYNGGDITQIKFYCANESTSNYTASVKIWDSEDNVLREQAVDNLTYGAWNTVTLTNPLTITSNMELYIGYAVSETAGYPLAVDAGPINEQRGGYLRADESESWRQAIGSDGSYNMMVAALVEAAGRKVVINNHNRDFTGYTVYRTTTDPTGTDVEWTAIAQNITPTTYRDASPVAGATNYYAVAANYTDGQSDYSNNVSVFVNDPNWHEYSYDDGTAESYYQTTTTQSYLAVHFTPYIHPEIGHYDIKYVKFYLQAVPAGNCLVKIWYDNGTNLPVTSASSQSISYSTLTAGWNQIALTTPISITSGGYFVSFMGMPGTGSFGVDHSVTGHSLIKANSTSAWTDYTDGTFMLRTINDTGTGTDEEVAPSAKCTMGNYPNPFNPTTTISYNLAQPTTASLKIYDTRGRLVKTMFNNQVVSHGQVVWNGSSDTGASMASGVYFYRLEGKGVSLTQKMLLVK